MISARLNCYKLPVINEIALVFTIIPLYNRIIKIRVKKISHKHFLGGITMKQFMDNDFLLSTPTAQHLFHDYAAKMPILDYHCHINPKEIAERSEEHTSELQSH